MNVPGFKVATVSINYYKNTSLEKAIDRVFLEVTVPTKRARTSSSCPTATWMNTM